MKKKHFIALRMDDVGAASKRNEVYSNWRFRVGSFPIISGNWLFLKFLPAFRAWGPYQELSPAAWDAFFVLLEQFRARCTVAVTAAWIEDDESLSPYPTRFRDAASRLKEAAEYGLIEIANHGLTHCNPSRLLFRPHLFTSNRRHHREFSSSLPLAQHERHLAHSQDILQSWLGMPVVTFVPPGNVFLPETISFAAMHGIRYISCQTESRIQQGVVIMGNNSTIPFHDREIVLYGTAWLERELEEFESVTFVTIRELAAGMSFSCGHGHV